MHICNGPDSKENDRPKDKGVKREKKQLRESYHMLCLLIRRWFHWNCDKMCVLFYRKKWTFWEKWTLSCALCIEMHLSSHIYLIAVQHSTAQHKMSANWVFFSSLHEQNICTILYKHMWIIVHHSHWQMPAGSSVTYEITNKNHSHKW